MHSQLWLQMAADIFQRVLLTTGVTDDSIIGMSVVALQALVQLKRKSTSLELQCANPQLERGRLTRNAFKNTLKLYELNR